MISYEIRIGTARWVMYESTILEGKQSYVLIETPPGKSGADAGWVPQLPGKRLVSCSDFLFVLTCSGQFEDSSGKLQSELITHAVIQSPVEALDKASVMLAQLRKMGRLVTIDVSCVADTLSAAADAWDRKTRLKRRYQA